MLRLKMEFAKHRAQGVSLSLQGRSEQFQEDDGRQVSPVLFLVLFISLLHTLKKILISAPLFVHLEDGAISWAACRVSVNEARPFSHVSLQLLGNTNFIF